PKQRHLVGFRRGLELFPLELRQDEVIDRRADPACAFHPRNRGSYRCFEGPMFLRILGDIGLSGGGWWEVGSVHFRGGGEAQKVAAGNARCQRCARSQGASQRSASASFQEGLHNSLE